MDLGDLDLEDDEVLTVEGFEALPATPDAPRYPRRVRRTPHPRSEVRANPASTAMRARW